jgi:hypothetical protein
VVNRQVETINVGADCTYQQLPTECEMVVNEPSSRDKPPSYSTYKYGNAP